MRAGKDVNNIYARRSRVWYKSSASPAQRSGSELSHGAKWERGSALNKADGAGKGKKSLQTGFAVADQQFPALF